MNKDYEISISDRKDGAIVLKLSDGFFMPDFTSLCNTYGLTVEESAKQGLKIDAFKSCALRSVLTDFLANYVIKVMKDCEIPVNEFTVRQKTNFGGLDNHVVRWYSDFTYDSEKDVWVELVHELDDVIKDNESLIDANPLKSDFKVGVDMSDVVEYFSTNDVSLGSALNEKVDTKDLGKGSVVDDSVKD